MAKKRAKRKQKQIVVTKEKLQQIQEAKQEEIKNEIVAEPVETVKPVKSVKKIETKNEPLKDMLGNEIAIDDNVVYVAQNKNGRMITKVGKVVKCTNKSITILTEKAEIINVRNVIKINIENIVHQLKPQPVKKEVAKKQVDEKVVKPKATRKPRVKKQQPKKQTFLSLLKGMFTK